MASANAWMHYHTRHDGEALATQSRARSLTTEETALADALEQLFASGTHDFTEIAAQLSRQSVTIPGQSHSQWTLDILASTLHTINADLDRAYAENGFGA